MTGQVDEGRAVVIVCLDFSMTFGTVSHKIFIAKVMKYGLDEQTVKQIQNQLIHQAETVELIGTNEHHLEASN